MSIKKQVLELTFLYDTEHHHPASWDLKRVLHEIMDGTCVGTYKVTFDDLLTNEQARAVEIEMGGDGNYMLGNGT